MTALFSVRNLSVHTQTRCILSVPQLSIPKGCSVIIGPNGAGKSTLLRALLGFYDGDVRLENQKVEEVVKKGHLAWVGQHNQFNLPLTVVEYVLLGCAVQGAWFKQRLPESEYMWELLEVFDLTHLANQRIGYLSGGEQQRANIVRALLQNTSVLLLDEPFNHLDIRHQHRLMHYLSKRSTDLNIVMVLHDLGMAANYADYVVLMNEGQVVSVGCPQEVMTEETLSEVYQWPIRRVEDNGEICFRMNVCH